MTIGGVGTPNYGLGTTDALNEQKQRESVDQSTNEDKKVQEQTKMNADEQKANDQRAQQQQKAAELTGVGANFNMSA